MHDFITAVCSYVGSLGFGTCGTDLFSGHLPEDPVTCIVVIPTGGPRIFGSPLRTRTFQVLNREQDDNDALVTCNSIYDALHNKWCIGAESIQGRIQAQHEPGPHILDKNNHCVYTVSYYITSVN